MVKYLTLVLEIVRLGHVTDRIVLCELEEALVLSRVLADLAQKSFPIRSGVLMLREVA